MLKTLKWELKKFYHHGKVSILSSILILAILYLLSVQANILILITDSYGGFIKVLNIATALIGAYYIFLFLFGIW